MAQHDDRDGEVHVLPADDSDQLEDATEHPIGEGQGVLRMLVLPVGRRQRTGWRLRTGNLGTYRRSSGPIHPSDRSQRAGTEGCLS